MSSSKKLPTTTCLGGAIVPVKINSEFQGGCGSGEASIVVFLEPSRSSGNGGTVDSSNENNDDDSHIIRIQLLALVSSSSHQDDGETDHSDQSTLYECDIPASKLQSVWSKSSGNHNTFQLLSNLTRDLFLRGRNNDHSTTVAAGNQHHVHSQSQNNDTMHVHVSYELQQQQQVDPANNANTSLSLIIRQAVVHGSMMRIVYQTTMRRKQQQQLHDNNNATIHHCRILGRLLNESIRRQELLEGNVQVWKRSLEEHSQAEELSKATLLRNFVKLRNTLVQKHQDEVNELKATHAVEKKEWQQQQQQQSGSLKRRKRNPVDDKDEEEGDIDDAAKDDDNDDDDDDDDDRMEQGGKTLFDDRLVTRLANNTGPEINEYRERTLQPDAMVDFVQVQADVKKAKEEQHHTQEKERKKKPPP
ncbi:hypothetical protein IV203_033966 [Nitzschia inconspicua]|uniref:Uncharacterized protein n=1 Tax=Nitzschia inconspicua TaxID=303405 RepID=A0A9K3Q6G0_9STRA|nr:hypothetical protein IV203_033966 [Nitzschia inconspicua]